MWLESTGFATFVRESPSFFGYQTFLVAHTFGLCIVVGTSTIVAIRLLGFAPSIPLAPLVKLFPIMWFGFSVNLFSGSGLAAAAATSTIPNPIFIVKILCVFAAVAMMAILQFRVFRDPSLDSQPTFPLGRMLGGGLLACWMLAMLAGRLIAYSGVILTS
jgi:hypothetical protein